MFASAFGLSHFFVIRHSSFVIFSPICLKFVRHEIDHHFHARSIAIQKNRRGKHVLPAVQAGAREAKRIRERFSADLHLIYVGEGDEETAKKFRDAFAQLQLPPDSAIHYEKGSTAEAILGALAREKIDMIVAGALDK